MNTNYKKENLESELYYLKGMRKIEEAFIKKGSLCSSDVIRTVYPVTLGYYTAGGVFLLLAGKPITVFWALLGLIFTAILALISIFIKWSVWRKILIDSKKVLLNLNKEISIKEEQLKSLGEK